MTVSNKIFNLNPYVSVIVTEYFCIHAKSVTPVRLPHRDVTFHQKTTLAVSKPLSQSGLENALRSITSADHLCRETAARELCEWIVPWIRAVFLRRNVRGADVEALTVSAVSKVVLSVHLFHVRNQTNQFKSWVQIIAQHEFANWCGDKLPAESLDRIADLVVTQEAPVFLDDHDDLQQQLQDILDLALNRLSPRDAMIIRLRFFNPRHDFSEIADLLDISEVNARVIAYRSLRKLERFLRTERSLSRWMRNK
jgi:RNA polymerase sigma factor (sigma-70 family)